MNFEGSDFSKYKVLSTLGSGTYGTVYHVKSPTNEDLVIKEINLENLSLKKHESALKEVSIIEANSHPHVITYFSSCIYQKKLLILMEYASGGDLQYLINTYKKNRLYLSEKSIWKMLYEICLGVEYLHKNNIIHRDIKCLNIILNENKRIKIADMGVCKIFSGKDPMEGSQVGTPLYLSPEIIQHKPYDMKVDIWGIGCVAYNLACLEPPFQAENLISLARLIVKARPKPIPSCYSPRLYDFILRLMDKRPSIRPSISEVFELIPGPIKSSYTPPASVIRITPLAMPTPPLLMATASIKKPVKANSKDRIGSISKYPERFKMYFFESSRLTSSRSLCMKPMQNLLKNYDASAQPPIIKPHIVIRPTSGVIRRDLDMNRAVRPFSAASSKRTTVRDLAELD
jgi:NIMA (never in mitosis gene a)-related kinase 1/4/5